MIVSKKSRVEEEEDEEEETLCYAVGARRRSRTTITKNTLAFAPGLHCPYDIGRMFTPTRHHIISLSIITSISKHR